MFEELKELIHKKETMKAKQEKEKYIPFPRYIQIFIAYTLENIEEGSLPDRRNELSYDPFDLKSFGPRKSEPDILGMDIPPNILALVRGTDPRAIAYRKSRPPPMDQSEPADSAQGDLEPNLSEELD